MILDGLVKTPHVSTLAGAPRGTAPVLAVTGPPGPHVSTLAGAPRGNAPAPAPVTSPTVVHGPAATAIKPLSAAEKQTILRNAGYNVTLDGIAGPQTNTAWNAFVKKTPAIVWNHAWAKSTAADPAPAAAPAAAPAPAAVPKATTKTTKQTATQSLLDQLLENALTPYKGPTPAEMLASAKSIASAELQPQIGSIQSQESQATTDATKAAQFEASLGQALGQILKSQGPATQSAYQTAGNDDAAYAKGYSGDLQDTATKSAQAVNDLLTSLGAPSGQQLDTSKATDAANVLYGTTGDIPASALAREGAAFTAAANQQPATAVGQGLQNSADQIQAGRDQVTKLASDLATLEQTRPGLVNNALTQLQSTNQANAGLDQNQKLLGVTLAQDAENFPGTNIFTGLPTKTQTTITQNAEKISASNALNRDRAATAKESADASMLRAVTGAQAAAVAAKKKPAGSMTQNEWKSLYGKADSMAENFYYGVPAVHNAQGDITTAEQDPVLYPQALDRLVAIGVPQAKAAQILNSYYLPGEGGRPAAKKKS